MRACMYVCMYDIRVSSDARAAAEGLPADTWSLTMSKHEIDQVIKCVGVCVCTLLDTCVCVSIYVVCKNNSPDIKVSWDERAAAEGLPTCRYMVTDHVKA